MTAEDDTGRADAPAPDALPPTRLSLSRLGRVVRATLGKLALLMFRVRMLGLENHPASGPAILAGNHVSYGDPILMWCADPRPIRFMAKAEMWEHPFFGWILPRVFVFPVRRGSADRAAIKIALELLGDGQLVGIFPEGTRNIDGQAEAQSGVAFIALKAGVPIIPVGVAGTDRIRPEGTRLVHFPRVTISYGEPIDPASFAQTDRRERLAEITEELMRRIRDELERARRT